MELSFVGFLIAFPLSQASMNVLSSAGGSVSKFETSNFPLPAACKVFVIQSTGMRWLLQ